MKRISLSFALAVLGIVVALPLTSCSSSTSSTASGADCKSVCAKVDALKCPNDTPGECAMQCDQSPAACKSQLDALTACGSTATYTCTADGDSNAAACTQQATAYVGCVFANSGFDGGLGGGLTD